MPKEKTIFMCTDCGSEFPRWEGQCKVCHAWNTLEEVTFHKTRSSVRVKSKAGSGRARRKPQKINQIDPKNFARKSTEISELDRTLGGGLVSGQVVLIAGHPGIGKSTLLLQLADNFNGKVLYVSGEESETQIALRAERLGVDSESLDIFSSIDVDESLDAFDHDLLIIDSIQVLSSGNVSSQAGSPAQIKECASQIANFAKENNVPVVIVGHITKEGSIAGPKLLEHMVDTVLYLEGDKQHLFRLLRVQKNRFGDDAEVGIFEMSEKGMISVKNPSWIMLENQSITGNDATGTAFAMILEGSRPLIVEVQALTSKTAFGYPKRAASGFSLNRLQLLCAVLQKRMNIDLLDQDVYLNIASGMNIKEPAVDLAVCAAIVSSYMNKAVKPETVFFGEVGLTGEVRRVAAGERRAKEAKRLGYKNIVSPENAKTLNKVRDSLI